MQDLDGTAAPVPFECFHAARVTDMDFVERQLHEAFGEDRVRPRREFSRVPPERIRAALKLREIEDDDESGGGLLQHYFFCSQIMAS